ESQRFAFASFHRSIIASFAIAKQVSHRGEKSLRLGLLHFLRALRLRALEVDHVDQFRRNVLEKPRGCARQRLAALYPLPSAREDEPLSRAGEADIAEPPLFLEVDHTFRGRVVEA